MSRASAVCYRSFLFPASVEAIFLAPLIERGWAVPVAPPPHEHTVSRLDPRACHVARPRREAPLRVGAKRRCASGRSRDIWPRKWRVVRSQSDSSARSPARFGNAPFQRPPSPRPAASRLQPQGNILPPASRTSTSAAIPSVGLLMPGHCGNYGLSLAAGPPAPLRKPTGEARVKGNKRSRGRQ
jgi:hypothetical protein